MHELKKTRALSGRRCEREREFEKRRNTHTHTRFHVAVSVCARRRKEDTVAVLHTIGTYTFNELPNAWRVTHSLAASKREREKHANT